MKNVEKKKEEKQNFPSLTMINAIIIWLGIILTTNTKCSAVFIQFVIPFEQSSTKRTDTHIHTMKFDEMQM